MTDVKIVQAPRARDLSGDTLEGVIARDIVDLTETLVTKHGAKHEGGGLGGRYGYSVVFENDIFAMHPFCWCEQSTCPWCEDQSSEPGDPEHVTPHFRIKGTDVEVRWYKWIGRSMEIGPADLTIERWREAFAKVEASLR